MGNILRILGILVLGGFLWAGSATAEPITVMDNYYGANHNGWGDVIGDPNSFDIQKAEIEQTGTTLTIDIHTNFAGLGHTGLFDDHTDGGNGIGYGDLFLSNSWTPNGSKDDHYISDNHENGTTWTYGFMLDSKWGTGGTANLYEINDPENILLSDDFIEPTATFRNGQEVALGGNLGSSISTGSWILSEGIISFIVDIEGTTLDGNEIAFHWGQTCGNDTIEGSTAPVPEPATMFLFGTGLIGMATVGRKKFRK